MRTQRSRTVLVAGATGMLGREVVTLLRADGHRVKTLSRDPVRAQELAGLVDEIVVGDATDPDTLVGAMTGIDGVISCLGAPMAFGRSDRRSFLDIDTVANLNLLEAAQRAGVRRFVYVSLLLHSSWAGTTYVRAHEKVVEGLRDSGISYAVVRPTGMFPVFDPLVSMARRGFAFVPGDGLARTNPVHPREVAQVCVDVLGQTTNVRIPLGGPEVLTRADIVRLAFAAAGRKPRLLHLPRWVLIVLARVIRRAHPRLAEVTDFTARALTNDFLAPTTGTHRLADHFGVAPTTRLPLVTTGSTT
ncbi:MAG: SDR family oxidoreductase [Aeromicrobium sp.]